MIVDSTVQEEAIGHSTDSRLLEVARTKLIEAAKHVGIALKQTFAKHGMALSHQAHYPRSAVRAYAPSYHASTDKRLRSLATVPGAA